MMYKSCLISKLSPSFCWLVIGLSYLTGPHQTSYSQKINSGSSTEFTNYQMFDHTLSVTSVRAGNHDKSGLNEYVFSVQFIGQPSVSPRETDQEKGKNSTVPKQIVIEKGPFANISVESLTTWRSIKNSIAQNIILVEGSEIRKLVAQTMEKFKIAENQVVIAVKIEMYEKNKKYWLIPEDKLISSIEYQVISSSDKLFKPHQDMTLEMPIDASSEVKFEIKYKNEAANDKSKKR